MKVVTMASCSSGSGITSFQELFTAQLDSISCFAQTPIIAAMPLAF